MSEIKVNKISPKQTCTQLTLGDSGDTIIIPAGATIQNSGTATGFGATGAVNWDTTPKTTTVTAVSGVGYFVDTTTTTLTVNLPVGTAGSIVSVSDYANIAATNNIKITPNGTDKIDGVNGSYNLATNGAAITLIYVDSTRGWKDIYDSTLNAVGVLPFITATGGTILTCGDFKTHVFTGPGTFSVSNAGTPAGSNSVEYLVVAGGGGGGTRAAGGAGAGGFRQNYPSPATAGLPVTATSYPITVGAGGAANGPGCQEVPGNQGVDSVFSTITSTGGGGGKGGCTPYVPVAPRGNGGSGGGGGPAGGSQPTLTSGGTGNTPPVSPSQGNPGGPSGVNYNGGGGGGAAAAGQSAGPTPTNPTAGGGAGGIGSPLATTFFGPTSPSYGTSGPAPGRYFAGGGGGGSWPSIPGPGGSGGSGGGGFGRPGIGSPSPTNPLGPKDGVTNTGGGGAGEGGGSGSLGGTGGSGIVVIRYKFQ
jgi:hypothetical protein